MKTSCGSLFMNGYAVCRKTYFPAQPQKPNKRNRQNRVFFDRRQRQTLSAAHWRHGRRQRHSFSKRQNCKGAFLRLIINFLGLCSKRAFFIQKNTGDLCGCRYQKKLVQFYLLRLLFAIFHSFSLCRTFSSRIRYWRGEMIPANMSSRNTSRCFISCFLYIK